MRAGQAPTERGHLACGPDLRGPTRLRLQGLRADKFQEGLHATETESCLSSNFDGVKQVALPELQRQQEEREPGLLGVLTLLQNGKFTEALAAAQSLPQEEADAVAALTRELNHRFVLAVRAISGSVLTGATQMLASEDLIQVTAEQSRETHRLSSLAEGLATALADTARRVATAAAGAEQALQDAAAGQAQVEQALQAMTEAATAFLDVDQRLRGLQQRVDQVENILNVIRRVAEQTHLLALNAAIEAARAGEAGRGFAVVAGEVRRLSEDTRRALRDVAQTVSGIREETAGVTATAAALAQQMATESEQAREAGTALSRIGTVTRSAADELAAVARATGEQASAVSEIATAAEGVSAATTRVEQVAGQVSAAVATLQRQIAGARKVITPMHLALTDDDLLEIAKADHLLWTHRLQNMIAGRDQLRPEQILPARDCRLGQWLARSAPTLGHLAAHRELATVHEALHQVPRALITAWNRGDSGDARRLFTEVRRLSDQLMILTDTLQAGLRGTPQGGSQEEKKDPGRRPNPIK